MRVVHMTMLSLLLGLGVACGSAQEVESTQTASQVAIGDVRALPIAQRRGVDRVDDYIDPPRPTDAPSVSVESLLRMLLSDGNAKAYMRDLDVVSVSFGRYTALKTTNEAGERHLLDRLVYLVEGGTAECRPAGPVPTPSPSSTFLCTATILVDAQTNEKLVFLEEGRIAPEK